MMNPTDVEDTLSTTSFDDPVPSGSERASATSPRQTPCHEVAKDVQHVLQQLPGVIVDSLAVRQLADGGLLLEGTVQVNRQSPSDFAVPVREATGVLNIVDRLRVRRTSSLDETQFEGRDSAASPRK